MDQIIPAPDYCGYLCEPNSICLGGVCEPSTISLGVFVSQLVVIFSRPGSGFLSMCVFIPVLVYFSLYFPFHF